MSDTIPVGPPIETMNLDAMVRETLARLRSLEMNVSRIDSELCERGKQIQDLVEGPSWVGEVLEAVGKIEQSQATVSRVGVLFEELHSLKSRCEERHEFDAVDRTPSNGSSR